MISWNLSSTAQLSSPSYLQTKVWSPDLMNMVHASIRSHPTYLLAPTSLQPVQAMLNDSPLPKWAGLLLTDLIPSNVPGHLLESSLPFFTCLLLSTFETLLILGMGFPHSQGFSVHPTCSPFLGIFIWGLWSCWFTSVYQINNSH